MQLEGDRIRVGQNRDAPQRRFLRSLAFVAVMFYIVFGTGQVEIGARISGSVFVAMETSAECGLDANPDHSAVRPKGVTGRKAGSSAKAAATRDPDTVAKSAVLSDTRLARAKFACLKALRMKQAGGSAVDRPPEKSDDKKLS